MYMAKVSYITSGVTPDKFRISGVKEADALESGYMEITEDVYNYIQDNIYKYVLSVSTTLTKIETTDQVELGDELVVGKVRTFAVFALAKYYQEQVPQDSLLIACSFIHYLNKLLSQKVDVINTDLTTLYNDAVSNSASYADDLKIYMTLADQVTAYFSRIEDYITNYNDILQLDTVEDILNKFQTITGKNLLEMM